MRSYLLAFLLTSLLAAVVLAVIVASCSSSGSDGTTSTLAAGPATTQQGTDTTAAPGATDTTGPSPTTTRPPRTTTSTRPPRSTTSTAPPRSSTTTTAPGAGGQTQPPIVTIVSPIANNRYEAAWDENQGAFGAFVELSATAVDPESEPVTITWSSNVDGPLGSGASITAFLRTVRDTSQPVITATATDSSGASSQASVQIIVWIPSDQG